MVQLGDQHNGSRIPRPHGARLLIMYEDEHFRREHMYRDGKLTGRTRLLT